eukprot:maker-scaffold439_size171548-snap-gene-0.26 protein:Tk02658 transcript:maker-scaffold439_size171548-snap-gene-0.26-mRNA-1 annotation:"AGAP007933-PA"
MWCLIKFHLLDLNQKNQKMWCLMKFHLLDLNQKNQKMWCLMKFHLLDLNQKNQKMWCLMKLHLLDLNQKNQKMWCLMKLHLLDLNQKNQKIWCLMKHRWFAILLNVLTSQARKGFVHLATGLGHFVVQTVSSAEKGQEYVEQTEKDTEEVVVQGLNGLEPTGVQVSNGHDLIETQDATDHDASDHGSNDDTSPPRKRTVKHWDENVGRVEGVGSVRLVRLSVPSHKFIGDKATLGCLYDLEREQLYSVKWYKDGNEFYRYIPGDIDQTVTIFRLPGVRVDQRHSDKNHVTLRNMNLKSAGQYRCEVSAEAPLFNTVSRSSRMDVVVLPRSGPRISGGKHTYHVGDKVRVNCTSERSKPAATLHWYINNAPAAHYYLHPYPPIQHEDGLETAILGLEFEVTPRSFPDNELSISLRCSSSISTVNSEAQTTETHHQKSSVHFSYGSLFAS